MHAVGEIHATSSKADPEMSYSDQSYITIRSGKCNSNSTVCSHETVLKMDQFQGTVKFDDNISPAWTLYSDNGADNKSYPPKTSDEDIWRSKD